MEEDDDNEEIDSDDDIQEEKEAEEISEECTQGIGRQRKGKERREEDNVSAERHVEDEMIPYETNNVSSLVAAIASEEAQQNSDHHRPLSTPSTLLPSSASAIVAMMNPLAMSSFPSSSSQSSSSSSLPFGVTTLRQRRATRKRTSRHGNHEVGTLSSTADNGSNVQQLTTAELQLLAQPSSGDSAAAMGAASFQMLSTPQML